MPPRPLLTGEAVDASSRGTSRWRRSWRSAGRSACSRWRASSSSARFSVSPAGASGFPRARPRRVGFAHRRRVAARRDLGGARNRREHRALRAGDAREAAEHARRAAGWYAPGAPHVASPTSGSSRSRRTAEGLGDREPSLFTVALRAHGGDRDALDLAPHEADLARANVDRAPRGRLAAPAGHAHRPGAVSSATRGARPRRGAPHRLGDRARRGGGVDPRRGGVRRARRRRLRSGRFPARLARSRLRGRRRRPAGSSRSGERDGQRRPLALFNLTPRARTAGFFVGSRWPASSSPRTAASAPSCSAPPA